ncbi:zf-HC2 domain-containing protein [Micromonospora cathayae]|uniref:Zf-HC2 domain-containing protein n=1 Tax=Micromonospora cathayae TaxID=3028804 RepID=A0ABY7ZXW8_9ACTN|nr:zf-HC2 domain-containing protein [Micromonospora sp. HUAS 3]WDZ87661.1 zf-HC2 domain-containing protein [Micromonospora sp. HUAS 3]
MSRADHWDVAAYALGVLDQQDTERFEEHLAGCWACAAELETMVPVVGLLSGIDGDTMTAVEQTATDPALLDRTLAAVRADRRRARMRQVLATAAAVVAFSVLTGVGIGTVTGGEPGGPPVALPTGSAAVESPQPGPTRPDLGGVGGPDEIVGDKSGATDQVTGVRLDVILAAEPFGTQVAFQVSRLPGPRKCRLVLVHADASTEVVSSWSVPAGGYGTGANSVPLRLSTNTATARDQIRRLQVQSVDAAGVATPLVTVTL